MPEAKAVNEASGKVPSKVVLNLGALPPKQNIADMKKDGQNVSVDGSSEIGIRAETPFLVSSNSLRK
jgi:hypothetical protein